MQGPSADRTTIKSHADFRRLLPRLIAQQDKRPELAIAALANPLLALEELGYAFAPAIRPHMERLARFGEERTAEYDAVEKRIASKLGADVDLTDHAALAKAVIAKLPKALLEETPFATPAETSYAAKPAQGARKSGVNARAGSAKAAGSTQPPTVRDLLAAELPEPPQRRFRTLRRSEDPLAPLAGRNALIDDMLALREIEGSRARLADRDTFRKILEGELRTPITRVRFKPAAVPPDGGG